MQFNITVFSPQNVAADCIVLAVFDEVKLADETTIFDQACQQSISDILAEGDLPNELASILVLNRLAHHVPKRIILVRLGEQKSLNATALRKAFSAVATTLLKLPITSATICLPTFNESHFDTAWLAREATQQIINQSYRFDTLKSEPQPISSLEKIELTVSQQANIVAAEKASHIGQAIAHGVLLTKKLGDLPANICTPTYLAQAAQTMSSDTKNLETEILEESDLKKLGMGSFLSVTQGSTEPPKLIVLKYIGAKKTDKPVVFVGKGITFDSGGISLKPGDGMDEMKYDMCGAGTVLGVFQALIELKLPINVVGIIPTCENMPSGKATKPGDIVTSLSGQTIEVLNTDAEGRLILCDALTYAKQFQPDCVIDIATLTGACIIALGHVASGLFSNTQALADALLNASARTGDKAWQLPLFEEYQEQLKSHFADMANIGGRPAGSATAASFLARFTKEYEWAHLDIAGTAWTSGNAKGATGRPVPLLIEFLLQKSQQNNAQ